MINYSILVSLFLIIILLIQKSPFIWPGVFFFLSQAFLLFLLNWLIKYMKKKRTTLLLSVVRQFQIFFGIMFSVWIGLAVFGQLTGIIGHIFVLVFAFGFLALSVVLMMRIMIDSDLLDQ